MGALLSCTCGNHMLILQSELGEEACQRGCGIRRQTVLPTLCKSRQVALLQEAYVTVIRDSAATTSN